MDNFQYNFISNTLTFKFNSQLDTANTQIIADDIICIVDDQLQKLENKEWNIVFDLKGVDYIASAFLRLCIRIVKKVGADNFSVINTIPIILKIFKIAGLDRELNVL